MEFVRLSAAIVHVVRSDAPSFVPSPSLLQRSREIAKNDAAGREAAGRGLRTER